MTSGLLDTSVVIDYQIAARFFANKALLHIHEIPTGAARRVLRALGLFSRARLIFNSRATRDSFAPPAGRAYDVIYNGLDAPASAPAALARTIRSTLAASL